MDDIKLIELLKANDVLYNKDHPLSNPEYKKQVWDEIAAEMGFPAELVIRRYRTLRDRFVRYKRSVLTKGPCNSYDPVIMQKMEFVTPYIFIKTSRGKIIWDGPKPDYTDPLQISSMHDEYDTMPLPSSTKYSMHSRNNGTKTSASVSFDNYDSSTRYSLKRKALTYNDSSTQSNNLKMKFDFSMDDIDSSSDITMHDIIKKKAESPYHNSNDFSDDLSMSDTDFDDDFCEAVDSFKALCDSREQRKENEALQGFGKMIVATIAKMNISKQTKTMMLVTEAVMQIKMEDED